MRCDMKCKMWVVKCKTGARTSIASDTKGKCDRKCYAGIQGYCYFKKKWKTCHISNGGKTLTIRKTHLIEPE